MKKLLSNIKFLFQYIITSIGFYPTFISFFFFSVALLMLYLETQGLSKQLKDSFPLFIISNGETARLILSTIAGGIISLTVFSFTMVMLVLNQASANFTPRVIPGLISQRGNQGVLGLYLGTLIYTLVIIVNIRSDYYPIPLPGFSIFLAMCFTIICLGYFVYFIHNVSQSIQIESILESIFTITRTTLEHEIERDKGTKIPNVFQHDGWQYLASPETGYIQSLDEKAVLVILRKHEVVLDFNEPLGNFLVKGVPFARINKKLPDMDKFAKQLFGHVDFYREERPDVNYLFGFKHITESAVKALSPGINDPGTAIKAIDYLTALFAVRMELTDEKVLYDEDGAGRIRFKHETFGNLYAMCLSPIRLYGKSSTVVIMRLLYLLKCLLYKVQLHPEIKPVLHSEALLLICDADKNIENPGDRQKVNVQIKEINEMQILMEPLPLLKD